MDFYNLYSHGFARVAACTFGIRMVQPMANQLPLASIAAFLASDDASYITGETIYVDGGRMPLNYVVPVSS